jgi:GT2 family glycosyltransferase
MFTNVSVIIVNYNAGHLLTRCLEALRKQTLKPRQIYVVDNASQDGSCDRISGNFPEVTLIRLEQNTGFAAANNLAVHRAEVASGSSFYPRMLFWSRSGWRL